jgi:hypothetical protein
MPIAAHPFSHWRRFDVGSPPYYPKTEMPASDRTCGPWRRKDEMKNQDQTLDELRAAYWTIQMNARIGLPKGYRSTLDQRRTGYGDPPNASVCKANRMMEMLSTIPDNVILDCVSMAMKVRHGVPIHSRKDIATKLNVSERTVSRLLANGLQHIRHIRNTRIRTEVDEFALT